MRVDKISALRFGNTNAINKPIHPCLNGNRQYTNDMCKDCQVYVCWNGTIREDGQFTTRYMTNERRTYIKAFKLR